MPQMHHNHGDVWILAGKSPDEENMGGEGGGGGGKGEGGGLINT